MEDHSSIPYLREVVIFLVSAGVVVPLLNRLRISPVLGYLVVGGVVGPFGLGLLAADVPLLHYAVISDIEGVRPLAELGVVFLLFMIGLELSFDRLWSMRRLVFGLGGAQILVTGLVIGLIAYLFENSIAASIVLGACLALSSTAIVMQLLMRSRRIGSPVGRASFAILLMQDLAVVPILFLVGVFGADEEANIGLDLLLALGKAGLAISLIYVTGRLVLRPVLRVVAQARSPEMFMAAILLTVIGTSAITGLAGLSMALGAFMAGLVIAETEFRQEVEVDIEPFKGLMLGLFFMSVGMGIDWREVGAEPFWIPASVVGLIGLKALITAGLSVAFGLPRHTAIEAGLLLGQGGEFAFIVIGLAVSLGLMPRDVGQFMLIVAGLTMLVTPIVGSLAARLGSRLEKNSAKKTLAWGLAAWRELEGHVIVAGFGRVGRTLAETLEAENTSCRARRRRGQCRGGAGRAPAGVLWRCLAACHSQPGTDRHGAGRRHHHGRAGDGRADRARNPPGMAAHSDLRPGAGRRPCPATDRGRGEHGGAGSDRGKPAACRPGARRARGERGGGVPPARPAAGDRGSLTADKGQCGPTPDVLKGPRSFRRQPRDASTRRAAKRRFRRMRRNSHGNPLSRPAGGAGLHACRRDTVSAGSRAARRCRLGGRQSRQAGHRAGRHSR
ncbi:MAG: monovalent cation:proton antiporter-2 (CPA2) family protein [Hyphomicrobiales bacterium]